MYLLTVDCSRDGLALNRAVGFRFHTYNLLSFGRQDTTQRPPLGSVALIPLDICRYSFGFWRRKRILGAALLGWDYCFQLKI